MKYKAKENHSRWRNCLLNITYYKLRAEKHFAYYIIGLGVESYRVGGAEEIINQALMIPRVAAAGKPWGRNRSSWPKRACTAANTMQSGLLNTVRDVVQANHRDGASGVDESRRVLRSQSEALQLGRQI